MTNDDLSSNADDTEATPEPEGPLQHRPMMQQETTNIWEDDSLSSLPPIPSPLEYSSASTHTPLAGDALVFNDGDASSLFSDKSLEDRLHRTLNQHISSSFQPKTMALEPTLEVARLVQQVEILRKANQELRNENKLLSAGAKSFERQREELVEIKMTAELREREAQQQVEMLQQQVEQANTQVKDKEDEIHRLKAQLEKITVEKEKGIAKESSVLNQAMQEANREVSSLRNENAALEQDKKDLAKVLEETQTLLEKATEECAARKVSMDVGTQTESHMAVANSKETLSPEPSSSTDGMNVDELEALVSDTLNRNAIPSNHSSNALPIGERLYRIRDAAERASLIKEHQREISRLSAAHELEKKQLLNKCEKEKDNLLEEAMSEMNAGYEGLRRRLEAEHERKMAKMERQLRSEMERAREEAEAAAASSTESLNEALAQVASANQRCQRETKRREALEKRLDQLQVEFNAQTNALTSKHATDLSKLGHGWEEEKRVLVDKLQRECNSVFDRTKSTSPRTVTTEFFADIDFAEKQHALSPVGADYPTTMTDTRSPTFSELDKTLRDTEAFVEKVLNSKIDD